jgi:hypothetical protein
MLNDQCVLRKDKHMNESRPIVEVWEKREDRELIFLVHQKHTPVGDNQHELWDVSGFSPDDGWVYDQAYGETVEGSCECVWRESDGTPLPEKYRHALSEDEK